MKILLLHAHPKPSTSIAQSAMLKASRNVTGITHHDLYAAYPDFAIDASREQAMLLAHDLIIMQHPFYWYSTPAIVKEWQDVVLDYGWAYGPGGDKLHGKFWLTAMSTGSELSTYQNTGRNRYTIPELLAPLAQTAYLCGMAFLEPFVIPAARRLSEGELTMACNDWENLLIKFRDDTISPRNRVAKFFDLPANFKKGKP
jgi:glutathione-regulated potassium-efflux system ancillary protein KefG